MKQCFQWLEQLLKDSMPKATLHRSKWTPWVKSTASRLLKTLSTLKGQISNDEVWQS